MGKIIVVTGGNSGIGKQISRKMVCCGAIVIIGSRDAQRNMETVKELSKIGKGKTGNTRL